MIILEGPDNAGKSTLAKAFGLPVIHPGAAPKTREAERTFFDQQQSRAESDDRKVVYDRITCISQQVYQRKQLSPWYADPMEKLLKTPGVVVIYCRPPEEILLDFSKHEKQAHDTEEQMAFVRDNARDLIQSYDKLMLNVPHVKYDFTRHDLQGLMGRVMPTQDDNEVWERYVSWSKATQKLS